MVIELLGALALGRSPVVCRAAKRVAPPTLARVKATPNILYIFMIANRAPALRWSKGSERAASTRPAPNGSRVSCGAVQCRSWNKRLPQKPWRRQLQARVRRLAYGDGSSTALAPVAARRPQGGTPGRCRVPRERRTPRGLERLGSGERRGNGMPA